MTLNNGKVLLKKARRTGYALGAFNATTLEGVLGTIRAAENCNKPVYLQYAEAHQEYIDLEVMGPIMVQRAKDARQPVVVHYDHGKDLDQIHKAMKMGFTSVMFDGADLPFSENVRMTREVVAMAKEFDVAVEGELGTIIHSEKGKTSPDLEMGQDGNTDPEQAASFQIETKVDMLAIAYGTAHGLYKERPMLDFQRLQDIAKLVSVPLVMHGGSGLTRSEFERSIACGISKINYYSDLANKVAEEVWVQLDAKKKEGKDVYCHDLSRWSRQTVEEDVMDKIRLFGNKSKTGGDLV